VSVAETTGVAVCQWGTIADWTVAAATFLAVLVALFQDVFRAWVFGPRLNIEVETAPPDCVAVPFHDSRGFLVANSYYVRFRVRNDGRSGAEGVEVYAKEVQRLQSNGQWQRLTTFPTMNLIWADVGGVPMGLIGPGTAKHCNLGRVVDPAKRRAEDYNSKLNLPDDVVSFLFELAVKPNHQGHIIGPGVYRVLLEVSARNATTINRVLTLAIEGPWYPDEATMLKEGLRVQLLRPGGGV
jgi:hypothetical protein